jgi:hypothetical protein
MNAMVTGGCLCGAVQFEVSGPLQSVTYCHCSRCRKWHGHIGAYTAVDRRHLRLVESSGLRWFASSPGVRRGFCGECGASLLWDEDALPKMAICAGVIDTPTTVADRAHIYVASKGDYYVITDSLAQYETEPKLKP